MQIYVAGPVARPNTRQRDWVTACYKVIGEVISSSLRNQAEFPVAEPRLESMAAGHFAAELTQRIRGADGVIAVFLPDDQSTPVECALAATAGKRVLLIHEVGTRVPRILAGLPGIKAEAYGPNTSYVIRLFLMG